MSPPSLSPETTQVLSGYGTGLAAAAAEFVPSAWMIAGTAANTAAKTSPPATRRLIRLNNFMILICLVVRPYFGRCYAYTGQAQIPQLFLGFRGQPAQR